MHSHVMRPNNGHNIHIHSLDPPKLFSDTVLQSLHSKCLDNGACWLCLDLDLLAERHPLARLLCWLVASLNHANSRKRELTCRLYLLSDQHCEGIQQLVRL